MKFGGVYAAGELGANVSAIPPCAIATSRFTCKGNLVRSCTSVVGDRAALAGEGCARNIGVGGARNMASGQQQSVER